MLVTNVKLENFSCGTVHFIGNRFEITIPAYSIGDDAVLSNMPSAVLAENLAALAIKAPYVAVTTIDEEDNGIPWPPIPEFMPYRKDNFAGAVAPGVNDDETQGYSMGSVWVNITASPHEFYRCADPAEGAAVWLNTTLEVGELGTAALSDAGDFEPAGAVQTAVDGLGTAALEDVGAFEPAGAVQGAMGALGTAALVDTEAFEPAGAIETAMDTLGTAALANTEAFEPSGAAAAAIGTLGTAAMADIDAFDPAGAAETAAQAAVDGHKDATTGVHGAATGTVATMTENGYLVGKLRLSPDPIPEA